MPRKSGIRIRFRGHAQEQELSCPSLLFCCCFAWPARCSGSFAPRLPLGLLPRALLFLALALSPVGHGWRAALRVLRVCSVACERGAL